MGWVVGVYESAKWGLTVYEPLPFDTHPNNTRATYALRYLCSKVRTYILKSRGKGSYILKITYVLLANECTYV